jgi:hypothetical protein
MSKRVQALAALALAAPLMAGLLWLGAGDQSGRWLPGASAPQAEARLPGLPAAPSAAVSGGDAEAAAASASTQAPAPAAPPAPVALTAEERRFILGEFVKAAEKDIAAVEKDLHAARAAGAAAEDISAREQRLRQMKQILAQTLARNTGV